MADKPEKHSTSQDAYPVKGSLERNESSESLKRWTTEEIFVETAVTIDRDVKWFKVDDVEKDREQLLKRILVVCRHCGVIRTLWDTIDECSYGGIGMCDCNWTSDNRVYYPYEELTVEDLKKKLFGEK